MSRLDGPSRRADASSRRAGSCMSAAVTDCVRGSAPFHTARITAHATVIYLVIYFVRPDWQASQQRGLGLNGPIPKEACPIVLDLRELRFKHIDAIVSEVNYTAVPACFATLSLDIEKLHNQLLIPYTVVGELCIDRLQYVVGSASLCTVSENKDPPDKRLVYMV